MQYQGESILSFPARYLNSFAIFLANSVLSAIIQSSMRRSSVLYSSRPSLFVNECGASPQFGFPHEISGPKAVPTVKDVTRLDTTQFPAFRMRLVLRLLATNRLSYVAMITFPVFQ